MVKEKISNHSKNLGKFGVWKKILLYGGLSLFLFAFLFSFISCAIPGLGISGVYFCYSDNLGNGERLLVEKLSVSLNNTCVREIYFNGTDFLEEPIKRSYPWKVRYNGGRKYSDDSSTEDIGVTSKYEFSFETEDGRSMFQYYFFPVEKRLCSKSKIAVCENGLAWFEKI